MARKKTPKPQKFLIGSAMYILLFAGGAEGIGGSDDDTKCGGEERWEQKVMIDPEADQVNETPQETTIEQLLAINTKTKENKYTESRPRRPFESQVFKIKHCFITDVLREDDNDLHIVIEDGKGHHMIAEIPDPKCGQAKKSNWIDDFTKARKTMLDYASNYRHYLFTVTGVLFVDRYHRQTGAADNNVEVHPILDIKKEKKINPILK